MTKNRPPSRLLSWISQLTRRSSSSDDPTDLHDEPSPPPMRSSPSDDTIALQAAARSGSEPINVPRPSIALSVAGTIDTCFYSTSSLHSSFNNNVSCSSSPRRASAISEIWRGNEDPLMNSAAQQQQPLGASYPEKRFSFHHHHHHNHGLSASPPSPPSHQHHRPASVFSLPPPNTRANRDEPRPRLSCDMDAVRSPTLSNTTHGVTLAVVAAAAAAAAVARDRKQQQTRDENDDYYWPRADRMIIRQELVRLALDGLFCSPVNLSLDPSKERKILHIGCGNGAWCMDMAKLYKHCWVLGIDDRDVVDRHRTMPSNFQFMRVQRDILSDLKQLPEDQFDFIYGRFLVFSFSPDVYREIIQECWRLCRSSGYVEMMELDMRVYGNPHVGPMTQELNAQVMHLMERRSLDPHFAQHLQDLFFFHELVEQMHQQHGDAYHAKHTSLPLGVWGGRIGVMFRDDLHDLIEMIHMREQRRHRPPKRRRPRVFAYAPPPSPPPPPPPDADLNANDDDDDDNAEMEEYDPWADQRLRATLERMDEELETNWAFMNLHNAYAQKL